MYSESHVLAKVSGLLSPYVFPDACFPLALQMAPVVPSFCLIVTVLSFNRHGGCSLCPAH